MKNVISDHRFLTHIFKGERLDITIPTQYPAATELPLHNDKLITGRTTKST